MFLLLFFILVGKCPAFDSLEMTYLFECLVEKIIFCFSFYLSFFLSTCCIFVSAFVMSTEMMIACLSLLIVFLILKYFSIP